jgi:hypothetical protein
MPLKKLTVIKVMIRVDLKKMMMIWRESPNRGEEMDMVMMVIEEACMEMMMMMLYYGCCCWAGMIPKTIMVTTLSHHSNKLEQF